MKKQRLKNFLKIGILIFGISLIIVNCQKNDNFFTEENIIEPVTDSTVTINENIKFIESNELPDAFKNALFSNFPEQKSIQAKQNLLETNFEAKVSVVISNNGIITYALPIKNSKTFKASLKKGAFKKQLDKSNLCDDLEEHEVLAMNFDSGDDGGVNNGLTHLSFSPGVEPGTTYITITNPNTGVSESLPVFVQEHINSINEAFDNSEPSNSSGSIIPIFTGIWQGIEWAGSSLINLFIVKKCKCNSSSKILNQQKSQTFDDNVFGDCCSENNGSKNTSTKENSNNSDTVYYQFAIPLPDSLFKNSKVNSTKQSGKTSIDEINCECRLNDIEMEYASELIKQDIFECACANDNTNNIALYLTLDAEQTAWLAKPENKYLRDAVCKYTKDNNYSIDAFNFVNAALNIEKTGGIADFENEILKDSSFIGTKADCVLNALISSGNNLFKKTSQAFTDGKSKFKLKFLVQALKDDGRIAETPLPNDQGIIEIRFDPDYVNSETAIEFANTILHESTHAELHRIKLTNNSGPNSLPNHLYNWYVNMWKDYEKIYSYVGEVATHAEHYYMANLLIDPFSKALREFDDFTHSTNHYKALAWQGLEDYKKAYITNDELKALGDLYDLVKNDNHENTCD